MRFYSRTIYFDLQFGGNSVQSHHCCKKLGCACWRKSDILVLGINDQAVGINNYGRLGAYKLMRWRGVRSAFYRKGICWIYDGRQDGGYKGKVKETFTYLWAEAGSAL